MISAHCAVRKVNAMYELNEKTNDLPEQTTDAVDSAATGASESEESGEVCSDADKQTAKEGGEAAARQTLAQELYDWLEILVISIAAVVIIFTLFFRIATVDGGSMLPTLTNGERLVVSELFYQPKQGDIVVCQSAKYGMEIPLVKRVIALGGQTIRIDFENWKVYVDGEELSEEYINYIPGVFMNGWDYGESYTVPEGYVFVMGDNRNNSQDSRREIVGPIDERLILGKAILGISSKDGIRIFD